MATITYTEDCPLCGLEGKQTKLMGEVGKDKMYCANGHDFDIDPENSEVRNEPVEAKPFAMTPPPVVPVPEPPPTPEPEGRMNSMEDVAASFFTQQPPPPAPPVTEAPLLVASLPNGDGVFLVRVPELNFRHLKAAAEELKSPPAECFQRSLEFAFSAEWFEQNGWMG